MEKEPEKIKPKFYVTHDRTGLCLWLSKVRPQFSTKKKRFEQLEQPLSLHIRLPYSWFGHMMRENSSVEIDIEEIVIQAMSKKNRTWKGENGT